MKQLTVVGRGTVATMTATVIVALVTLRARLGSTAEVAADKFGRSAVGDMPAKEHR